MVSDKHIERQWGKTSIKGGRHAFRIAMVLRAVPRVASPPARVLDAGCGDGDLSVELMARGYRVSAVDSSELCIERLKKNMDDFILQAGGAAESLTEIKACKSGLYALPFPVEYFDLVVSGEVLEHLDHDEAAVDEISRVLSPGGYVVATVPANPGLWGLEDEWAGHKRRYSKSDFEKLFTDRGFKTIELCHWGWPVTWLYNRILYQAWLKRKLGRGEADMDTEGSAAASPLVMKAMYWAFSIDRLFSFLPFGIGLIGVFRKM